jgi:Ca-activated chloride channel family protein
MLSLLVLRGERLRREDLNKLAEPELLDRLAPLEQPGRRLIRHTSALLGMLFLVIALMQPQWGLIEEVQITNGMDIIIALDVSRSMLANDSDPNRLAVAKKAVASLITSNSDDRIGLLAFAGSAFLVCPLTADHAVVRQMLDELGPESIPLGGSSIAAALEEAERAFRGTPPGGRVLVVVSDGEDHRGGIMPALSPLRSAGVSIIAGLAGTPGGALIPLPGGGFVKDRSGAVIMSRARMDTLRTITSETVTLDGSDTALKRLFDQTRAAGATSAGRQKRRKLAGRFQYPLAAALFLLFLPLVTDRERRR